MVYFIDSSGIVKRYVQEAGSVWVRERVGPPSDHRLYVAGIAGVEVVSAVVGRARSGDVSPEDAQRILNQFRDEFQNLFHVIEIAHEVIDLAMELAEKHGLRGYDAVQLSAAKMLHEECARVNLTCTLISADVDLNAAAVREGISVDNPSDHA